MKKIFLIAILLFLSGCTTTNNYDRIEGIVDACYTVSEYNPPDAESRVYQYLTAKVEDKEISEDVAVTIEKCIKRSKVNRSK